MRLLQSLSRSGAVVRLLIVVAILAALAGVVATQPAAGASGPVPTNLLYGDQTSFTASAGGWTPANATLAWDANYGNDAPGSIDIVQSGSGYFGALSPASTTAATSDAIYWSSAWLDSLSGTDTASAGITFYSASGAQIGTVFGQSTSIVDGAWTQLNDAVGLAPANTAYVQASVEVYTGSNVLIDDADIESLPDAASSAVTGPLTTSGNQLLDGNGNPIQLHGGNWNGLLASVAPTETPFIQMKAWGYNEVRLFMNESLWDSTSCAYSSAYAGYVNQVVNWVTSLGMVAMMSLYENNPADFGSPSACAAAKAQVMADNPGSDQFWTQVATQYAGNPLVIFDLYNEPEGNPGLTASQWLNGGTVTNASTTFPAEGMQELYNDVRGANANNLVVMTGQNYGGSAPSDPPTGRNILFGIHDYTCSDTLNDCTGPNGPLDPTPVLDNWTNYAQTHAVMVTEFGWPTDAQSTYNARVISDAQALGWGWNEFSWQAAVPFGFLTSIDAGTQQPGPASFAELCAMAADLDDSSSSCLADLVQVPAAQPGVASVTDEYDMAASDGGVFTFGDAGYYGSTGNIHLVRPVVGSALTPDGKGYWLVASDGGIFAFGDAGYYGSTGAMALARPIVGMAATPDGKGYWLVASDGGIFAFGDAGFKGSTGAMSLVEPIVGMAPTPDGQGYWLAAADGGIFAFGDAGYYGSIGGGAIRDIVGFVRTVDGGGYEMVGANGALYSFGDAPNDGSLAKVALTRPIVTIDAIT